MFTCVKIQKIEDYFIPYSNRICKGVYFGRLTAYSPELKQFLIRYLEDAKRCGVYVKGKIPNPDGRQLSYFEEMIGLDFQLDHRFFDKVFQKWLPRLDAVQRESTYRSMLQVLNEMKQEGKNEGILKNAYIKFMCWFYYKFERILNQLGKDKLPKILYEGYVTNYELKVLRILSSAGCDILLLQCEGDEKYLTEDRDQKYSHLIATGSAGRFPAGFSALHLEQDVKEQAAKEQEIKERTAQPKFVISQPSGIVSANTWLSGDLFADALKSAESRGSNSQYYYNMFVRIRGVEEKTTYLNELFRWKMKLESASRTFLLVERIIEIPTTNEIQKINRNNYQDSDQMFRHLCGQISFPKCPELEKLLKKAFLELLEEDPPEALQKQSNKAICILCWILRYIPLLFPQWSIKSFPIFLLYGVCDNSKEALFLRLLSRLPVDVFIMTPDLSQKCILEDKMLFEKKYDVSLKIEKFPTQIDNVQFGTVAFHAEQDLNTIMYQDTGMYRNQQFKKAIPIGLSTTYEEIRILWNQDAVYRPNFETLHDRVMVPVIFSKVSGVPGGNLNQYWDEIEKLLEKDAFLIKKLPFINKMDQNPMKQLAASFLKNGKIQKEKILNHPSYSYGFIREDMQDYIFDMLQQFLDKKIIEGTFRDGSEYAVVSTVLNMDKQILRMIQKFDFTKTIPKVVVIHTGEEMCSLEDSILLTFLNFIGFDVVLFIPTGYQSIERYFETEVFIEHQVGEYMYDLVVPNLKIPGKPTQRDNFASRIFKRGR